MLRSASSAASARDAPSRRAWARAALWSSALLVLPLLAWLLFPMPRSPARSERPPIDDAPSATVAAAVRPARLSPAAARSAARQPEASAGGIEGVVLTPEGAPAANASVTCASGDRELTATSDEAGRFRLAADAAGCKAVARKKGAGASAETELRAGSTTELRLVSPTGIAGNVVDEKGAPVMVYGIGVSAFTPVGGDAGAPLVLAAELREIADAEGAFELTDLAPGRYELIVGPQSGALTRSQPIEVRPGAMTRGVRVALAPGVTVIAVVTDAATHERIEGAGARVTIGGIATRPSSTQNGEVTLDDAPAGRFDLIVTRMGYMPKAVRDLDGRPGGTPLRVEIALDRFGAR